MKAATNRADHKQSSKDRVQAASEGAIHGTSIRKGSDDAIGRVVVQRPTNGNDREESMAMIEGAIHGTSSRNYYV
jgi:hypothetical protein